jgi:hypothetical protein
MVFANQFGEDYNVEYKDTYEGLRVMLSNPKKNYHIGMANPAVGTKWQCGGVINSLLDSSNIDVKWDNGASNMYSASDLCCEKDITGLTGRYTSIW